MTRTRLKTTLLAFTIAFAWATLTIGLAQSASPLSGTWNVIEPPRGRGQAAPASGVVPGGGQDGFHPTIIVTQTPTDFRVEGVTYHQGEQSSAYKLKGDTTFTNAAGTTKATALWDGQKMTVTEKRTFSSPAGQITVDTKDIYSLANGNLTLDRVQTGPTGTTHKLATYRPATAPTGPDPRAAKPAGDVPGGPVTRLADGKPDMQGYWGNRTNGGAPNNNVEYHPPSFVRAGGRSMIIDPPDGKIPYQPWALAERDARRKPENSYDDPELHCYLSGVPRQMFIAGGGMPMQILQPDGYVVLLMEYIHAYRVIALDGRPHPGPGIQQWQGDSVGHWEGDTLVVDTRNNNGRTWFELSGNFMSDAVHQVERLTMTNSNLINYEITIEDPKVYTRPWKMAFGFARDSTKGLELMEEACHEDNSDLQHLRAIQEGARKGAAK